MKTILFLFLVFFLAFSVNAQEETTEETSKTNISGTIGVSSMYHDFEVGGDTFRGFVQNNSFTVERKLNKKVSVYGDFWGQYALAKRHPNEAEEFYFGGGVVYNPRPTTTIDVYAGNSKLNHGINLQMFGVTVEQETSVGKVPLKFSNNFIAFKSSKPHELNGGVVNKTNVSSFVELRKKIKLTGEAGVGFDNGPLGFEGPATLLFFEGEVEREINKNWSAFFTLRHTRPIAGETLREPITSASFGLKFNFDFK